MKQKETVAKYFLSQITAMEYEVQGLQAKVRTRRIDVNDSFEMAIALVRLELMKQVCRDISVFLRIDDENNIVK